MVPSILQRGIQHFVHEIEASYRAGASQSSRPAQLSVPVHFGELSDVLETGMSKPPVNFHGDYIRAKYDDDQSPHKLVVALDRTGRVVMKVELFDEATKLPASYLRLNDPEAGRITYLQLIGPSGVHDLKLDRRNTAETNLREFGPYLHLARLSRPKLNGSH